MHGPLGYPHGSAAGTMRGASSRNPCSVSTRRQQRAMIAKPGMQWSAGPVGEGDTSGLLSATKSASMLLKNRSLIRLSKTPIAFDQASLSSHSRPLLRSFHSLLKNPKHKVASIGLQLIVLPFTACDAARANMSGKSPTPCRVPASGSVHVHMAVWTFMDETGVRTLDSPLAARRSKCPGVPGAVFGRYS